MNPDRRRLAALVVNYNSGTFAVRCVESLFARWAEEERDPEALEVVVIDNASPEDQEPYLRRMEAAGARVVRSEENLGYAGGVNRTYALTSGGPQDVVAILNPDLHFLPGNLATLMDYLAAHPECGVVGPRGVIDPKFELRLPRNPIPSLLEQVLMAGVQISPAICRAYSRRRLRDALPWWTEDAPLVTDMLSGCCLFLRREVVDALPRPMDERYPLYFEDTDLFRRLDEMGYTVVHHGGTTILHHWSRSSGVGSQYMGEPHRRFTISRRAYFRRYYGVLGWWAVLGLERLANLWPAKWSHRPMHDVQPLGAFDGPVEIPLPRSSRYLMELGVLPNWLLAVGIFGEGDRWSCDADTWEWFFPTEYFMRAIDLDSGELLGAWSFTKTSPGRTAPVEEHELLSPVGSTAVPRSSEAVGS